MKYIVIVFLGVIALGGGGVYLRSNFGLLGDEVVLGIASSQVIGNPVYGLLCGRDAYLPGVSVLPSDASVGLFEFRPKPGKESTCGSVGVIIDRRTGEAWIENSRGNDE